MEFATVLKKFTAAVEAGDGAGLAALFSEDGVYHDTFYGAFKGRAAIRTMLEDRFHADARNFLWDFDRPVCDGRSGYACWRFSYTSTLPGCEDKRVVVEGMSCFELEGGLIRHYSERFDSGMALVQLDFSAERLVKLFRRWNAEILDRPGLQRHLAG